MYSAPSMPLEPTKNERLRPFCGSVSNSRNAANCAISKMRLPRTSGHLPWRARFEACWTSPLLCCRVRHAPHNTRRNLTTERHYMPNANNRPRPSGRLRRAKLAKAQPPAPVRVVVACLHNSLASPARPRAAWSASERPSPCRSDQKPVETQT
jgi:hypothetical protein